MHDHVLGHTLLVPWGLKPHPHRNPWCVKSSRVYCPKKHFHKSPLPSAFCLRLLTSCTSTGELLFFGTNRWEKRAWSYRSLPRTVETILVHAQALVYTLLDLMPTSYQRDSLQALLGLFLEAQGHPLPQHTQLKSPGALISSRFE